MNETTVALHDGDTVRFRRPPKGWWQYGTVHGTNKDGSVNVVTDNNGMTRSLTPDRLETKRTTEKGKTVWQPVHGLATPNEPKS